MTDKIRQVSSCASLAAAIGLFFLLISCAPPAQPLPDISATTAASESAEALDAELEVMTHDSFAISESVLTQFESEHHVKVRFLKSGDTGTALNKAILSKEKPLADVFYGVDNTFLSRALAEGIFETYESPLLKQIPDKFELDPEMRALPVDYGDVCLNYDVAFLRVKELQPPETLEDLAKEEYKSMLVVENPATSSPGLSFMLATIGHFGESGFKGYWRSLVENDVLVVNGWESAYYTEFSGSAGRGPRPIVVSYNSSPVYEVLFAETAPDEPPTAAVTAPNTCFRQIEFVGILKGTQRRELAERWIDFMLSETFQEDLPMQMFVLPVNDKAQLEEDFSNLLSIPEETVEVSPEMITQNRERWLNEWTETVLR